MGTLAFALLLPIGMLGMLLALGRYEDGMLASGSASGRRGQHGVHRRVRRWAWLPLPHRRQEKEAR
ncbi:hypothetical protein GCM10027168_50670 [Streptomyces capparidis]